MYWIILFIQQYFYASTYTPGYDLAYLTLQVYNDCNDPKVLYETSDVHESDTFASDLRKYAQVDATTILNTIMKEVKAFEPKKEVMHQTIEHLLNAICEKLAANASHEGHEAIKKAYNDAACTAELEKVYSVLGGKAVYKIFECSVEALMIRLADESALKCFAISETTMQQKYDVIAKIFCKSIETGIIEVVESNDYEHLKGRITLIASKGKSGPLFDKLTGLIFGAVSFTVKIIASSSKYSHSNVESHEKVLQKATTIDIGDQSTGAGSLFKKLKQKANQVRTNPTDARTNVSKLMSDIFAKITSSMLPEDLEAINNVCDKADSFAELEIIYYAIGQKALTKLFLRMFKQSLKYIGVKENIRNLAMHVTPKEKYQIIGDWLRDLISVSVKKLCDKQEFSDKAYVIKHIAKNATEGEIFDKLTCLAYKAITYLLDIITSSSDYMKTQSFYVGETSTKSSELQNDLPENEIAESMRHEESIPNEGTSGNNQMSEPKHAQVGMHYLLNKIESKMLNGLLLTDTDDVLGSYIGKPALSAFYFMYIAIGADGFEAIISAYNERISKLKVYPFIKQTLSDADIEPKYKMISIALRKAFCNAVLEVVSKPKYRNLCSEIERLANKELTSIMIDVMSAELQDFIAALVEKLQPSSIESEDDASLDLNNES